MRGSRRSLLDTEDSKNGGRGEKKDKGEVGEEIALSPKASAFEEATCASAHTSHTQGNVYTS